jgi:hypothetical protein
VRQPFTGKIPIIINNIQASQIMTLTGAVILLGTIRNFAKSEKFWAYFVTSSGLKGIGS